MRGESQGSGVGVYGTSKTGTAVSGVALAKSGYGLRAENKVDGTGIFGVSASGTGIYGLSNTGNGIGVRGESKGGGYGVYAKSTSGNAIYAESTGDAIYAECKGGISNAIFAKSTNGVGVTGNDFGTGMGVRGMSNQGTAVYAEKYGSGDSGYGIFAKSNTLGIHVETSGNSSRGVDIISDGIGVLAVASHGQAIYGQAGEMDAVYGIQTGSGNGIHGRSIHGTGVYAESDGSGYGLYAKSATGRYAGYFEGNIRVTGQINPAGGDLAEEFDAIAQSEPGNVMVINNEGNLEPCYASYDRRVAGIVSGAEGYKPGMVLDSQEEEQENRQHKNLAKKPRLTVALTGKVYCKVDATQSPIDIGDMLTTSSTKGHAMKVDEPTKAFGAVIGKALRPLRNGMGIIPVLVGLF